MKKIFIFFVGIVFSTNVIATDTITFKSAKNTSSYYLMAKDISSSIKKNSKNSIDLKLYQSSGSVQNILDSTYRNGNKYLFTSPPQLIRLAIENQPPFEGVDSKSLQNIRFLFPLPSLSMHFIVKADSNISSFKDFKDKKLLIGEKSFGAYEAKRYARLFGLGGSIDFIEIDLNNIYTSFMNGEIDGFVTSGSYPSPNVVKIADVAKINILSLNDNEIEKSGRLKLTIPANTYKNITYDVNTTTVLVGAYSSSKMPENLAYKLTKYFWESKKDLIKKNEWWKSINLNHLGKYGTKIHKGALRYYKELNSTLQK